MIKSCLSLPPRKGLVSLQLNNLGTHLPPKELPTIILGLDPFAIWGKVKTFLFTKHLYGIPHTGVRKMEQASILLFLLTYPNPPFFFFFFFDRYNETKKEMLQDA